ncbi:MAG: rubrerythrin-like domain-containing protein [Halobacterium sp.]
MANSTDVTEGTSDGEKPHVYECRECEHRVEQDHQPIECPECGGRMQNVSRPSER